MKVCSNDSASITEIDSILEPTFSHLIWGEQIFDLLKLMLHLRWGHFNHILKSILSIIIIANIVSM